MSLSSSSGYLRRVSVGSAFLAATLVGAIARQAAALDEGGAQPTRLPKAVTGAASSDAARTISGRVVDAQGKPVDGARLWWVVQRRPGFTAAGRADKDGRFRLTTPADWVPRDVLRHADVVWALGPNKDLAVTCLANQLAKSDELTLRLNAAADVNFDVIDDAAQPVAGALIEPENYRDSQGFDLIPDPISIALRATTNATGHVRMHIGFRDFFNLRVTTDHLGIQLVRLNPRDRAPARTIQLQRVGRIEGRVTAKDPHDARGIRIGFRCQTSSIEGVATAVADEQGNFVVPNILAGLIYVNAGSQQESSAVAPRPPKPFALRPGDAAFVEIPVERLVIVRGSVRTEDSHAPVAGANVTVGFGNGTQGAPAITDAHGRFEVRVLPGAVNSPAIVALPTATGADYEQVGKPWDEKVNVPPGDQPFEMPPVILVRKITLKGKVVDHSGQPLVKATVCGDVDNRRYGFCDTDAKGEFVMRLPRSISPERYEVFAPQDDRHLEVTIVQKRPLVLKAVDWTKFAKPIGPPE